MTYTPPDLAALRASVSRDLRDPTNQTFTTQEVDDLINAGVVEVSRVYPKEQTEVIAIDADGKDVYPCEALSLFRVEVIDSDVHVLMGIPVSGTNVHQESGWDFHGGNVYIPEFAAIRFKAANAWSLRVWGYWSRDYLNVDGDAFDGDADAEFATHNFALMLGYQRLQNDRVLFQQWLTTTGNTDVSPNQLAQTADMYQSHWRETRQRIRILQRQ